MKLPPRKKKPHPIVQLWRDLPPPKPDKIRGGKDGELHPTITSMRGNPRADILLVAPPCSVAEYNTGLPMSDMNALVLTGMFDDIGLDVDSYLVVSCSRWGLKPSKKSTEDIRTFLGQLMKLDQFEIVICVGDDAFKHTFGRGKKPSMQSLAGNVLYVPETNYKPLFTFPSLDGLYVEQTPTMRPNDARRMFDWSEKVNLRFRGICQKLKSLLEKTDLL